MDDKDIKLLRAALLGKAYGMAIMDEVPFSMQCGTDHGVATLTMEGAFDYWLDNALYRESARDAYLSKFLEAWKIFAITVQTVFGCLRGAVMAMCGRM